LDSISLNSPVSILFGVGEKYAKLLEVKLGIRTIEDLLNHYPQRYDDFSHIKNFTNVQNGEIITVIGKIIETKNIFTKRIKIQEIILEDISPIKSEQYEIPQVAKLTFFNQPFILNALQKGMMIAVSGTAEKIGNKLQFKSPEYEIIRTQISRSQDPKNTNLNLVHTGRLVPVYPETRGISSKWLRARIFPLIKQLGSLIEESLTPEILEQENLINLLDAYKIVHYPNNFKDLASSNLRLAFNELLLTQLQAIFKKEEWQKEKTNKIEIQKFQIQIQEFIKNLPFALTTSQTKAIEEVFSDINSTRPMNRLLEGDVGSGKTVVATIAMYLAFLNGFSAVLMCPTEILANQHYNTINKLLSQYEVPIHLITSSANKVLNSKSKIPNFKQITDNKIQNKNSKSVFNPLEIRVNPGVYIGTHALIQKNINIPNLNLVVIDEQHRFGVEQRALLSKKGNNPHTLSMTATPIPRTMALTFYGNLDLSVLSDLPQKKQIKTWVVPPEKRNNAYPWIEKQIKDNHSQAFIVCPFIEPSETMESIKSARLEFENLKKIFKSLKLELLTGKTKPKEKQEIMNNFSLGKFDILVATPIVEVGIDIAGASIIVIEGAERFGLAAIHQLRGRVGRRGQKAYCLLFESESGNPNSLARLKNLETVNNGLELAEIDLKIRGSGNIFSREQHGFTEFKKANLSDLYLVEKAKNVANSIFPQLGNFSVLKKTLKNSKIENVINN
jgi:ATP-dependent DNA helicase RecG